MNVWKWISRYHAAYQLHRQEVCEPDMQKFTADFETTTDENDCRVWAYGICEIGNPENFLYGNSLDDFMHWCEWAGNPTVYFHNLAFDGEFILCWLFAHGYRHSTAETLAAGEFSTLISNKGMWYSLSVCFHRKGKKSRQIEFLDSYKILPFSVRSIAKGFGLEIQKGEIDYKALRPVGHQITDEELVYLRNDVQIVAMALEVIFAQNLKKMTAGSNALSSFKSSMPWYKFERLFPIPDYDADIRQSYRGGFTYLDPAYADRDLGVGIVLDVNSLYPSVMKNRPLPFGEGIHFEGRYRLNRLYPLYTQMLRCQFKLRPGYIPTIQVKHDMRFPANQYLESSLGCDVAICLTSVDLALFLEHYELYNVEWLGGWMFKSKQGLFDTYIDHWSEQKIKAKQEANYAMYTLSKLMLNSLYGKFATSPDVRSKIPLDNHGAVHYVLGDQESRDPIYIPVGTFITAWARDVTIRAAQMLYDRFVYADTDSLHLLGTDLPACLEIDDTKLGAWKLEKTFKRARYLKQKSYIEEDEQGIKVTCAGMSSACHQHVTWDNFHLGNSFPGMLKTRHVKGGIVLVDVPFSFQGKFETENQLKFEDL